MRSSDSICNKTSICLLPMSMLAFARLMAASGLPCCTSARKTCLAQDLTCQGGGLLNLPVISRLEHCGS